MGKKKKGGKGKKSAPAVPSALPEEYLKNYSLACKLYGCEPCACVKNGLETEEGGAVNYMFIDEPVGPAGVRAAVSALLGKHPDMKGGPYSKFTSLHFARCNAQADGAAAVAEVLRVGGEALPIANVQFVDCRVGERGCQALGAALGYGGNNTLKRLIVKFDETVGDRGASVLARSLRMNGAIEVLRLEYCNIGAAGARNIAKILEYGGTQLKELSLIGNPIGPDGLAYIAKSLAKNQILTTLQLKDCGVGNTQEDLEGLEALARALATNQTLEMLHFEENFIGDEGAEVFAAMEEDAKKNLKNLWIEFEGVSAAAFAAASITATGKKGKKGKKKKKKK
jgi:Ran GTPase-activating protein (RanGAP) involved in mRNA processing and transport